MYFQTLEKEFFEKKDQEIKYNVLKAMNITN